MRFFYSHSVSTTLSNLTMSAPCDDLTVSKYDLQPEIEVSTIILLDQTSFEGMWEGGEGGREGGRKRVSEGESEKERGRENEGGSKRGENEGGSEGGNEKEKGRE